MSMPSVYVSPRPLAPVEPATVAGEPFDVDEAGPVLVERWRVIRKHRWLILGCAAATTIATAIVVLTMTPIYTAGTTLLIEPRTSRVLEFREAVSEPLAEEPSYLRTQYQILKSRGLAEQVIREQGLERSAFDGKVTERTPGLLASLWRSGEKRLGELLGPRPASGTEPRARSAADASRGLVDVYLAALEVEPVAGTRLVRVAFSTPDRTLSTSLADAHASAYTRHGIRLRTQANEEALRFLEEKLVELKERVEKSEIALNVYRREKGILSLDEKENVVVERLGDLNRRVSEAEAGRIVLEAQVRLIHTRDYDSVPSVVENPLIQSLTGQLAQLESEYAQLATQFKPTYPALAQLKGPIDQSRRRLTQEIRKVVAGIESAYVAALDQETEFRNRMEEQKAATLKLKDASVEYAILAREVETNRELHQSVLQRMKEMSVAELRSSNVSIIDRAEPPGASSRPRKARSVLVALLAGMFLGVGLAFGRESLDDSLKTPEDVERHLHVPSLGVVPDFEKLDEPADGSSRGSPQRPLKTVAACRAVSRDTQVLVHHHPFSVVTESYRTIRTAVLLSRAAEPPRTLLFASGVDGEGKTTTAVNTAILFAQMGGRVLLIDADLRRPTTHRLLQMGNPHGLTEILTGQRNLQDVVRTTPVENLYLISAGALPPNPTELLASQTMRALLADVAQRFDYVLIDSPPVMAVNDPVVLASAVDGVVLVVHWQRTSRKVLRRARARLTAAGGRLLGVVLNRVNTRHGEFPDYYINYYDSHHPGPAAQGSK